MDANNGAVPGPLRRLAEAWHMPVMVSPKAKGVLREDHPLFVGTIEGLGTAYLYDFIDTCDLVLMVGLDPVEFDRDWSAKARIVHIGVVPNDDRYYGSEVEIVGPIDAAIERLFAASKATPKVARDEINAFRDAFTSRVRGSAKGLTAQEAMAEIETGTRLGLGVRVIVLADEALSQIKAGQERKGYAVTGTTFGAIDYEKLGSAFGIDARTVSTVAECREAFRETPGDRPTL